MKRLIAVILISLLCSLPILAGCAVAQPTGSQTTAPTTGSSEIKGADLMAGVKAAVWSKSPTAPDKKITQSISHFAAALLQASVGKDKNMMVSPASVFLALAMTVNGADGETKDAMLKVLTDQGITLDMINEASRSWISLLTATGSKTALSIANSIWFRDSFQPDLSFLQRNADYFGAGARRLDFAAEASTATINAWVKDATRGTIEKIVDKIPASTVMYLINAVYFKSDWQTPFDANETRDAAFNTPKGAVQAKFMHRTGKISYFTGNMASGVALPYDANGQFVFFALLPEDDMTPREWLAKQEQAVLFSNISSLMAQKANFTVALALPKFEVSYENVLNDELTSLGMGIAFAAGQADFSQLSAQRSKDLYISEVKHKTFIKVDEKGTEAAAVTSVAIDESAIMADVEMTFDRPFLYGILDHATGIPLFVGIMEDPTAK